MHSPADLVEHAERWANMGKIIIVAALDGTFKRKPFNQILQLVPLAEEVGSSSPMVSMHLLPELCSVNTTFRLC